MASGAIPWTVHRQKIMFMSTAKLEYVTGALLAINAVSSLYLVIESAHDVTVKGELSNFNKLQEY